MCGLPALIAGASGGNPIGATVGSMFGIPGAILGGMMGKKKPAATATGGGSMSPASNGATTPQSY